MPDAFAFAGTALLENWTPGFIPVETRAGQLLVLLTAGVFLGQQNPAATGRLWIAVASAMAAGLTSAVVFPISFADPVLLAVAVAAGALAALDRPLPVPVLFLAGSAAGLALGIAARPVAGIVPDSLVVMAANLAGAALLGFCILECARRARAEGPFWLRTGLRVIASWGIAVAVMMLALTAAGAVDRY